MLRLINGSRPLAIALARGLAGRLLYRRLLAFWPCVFLGLSRGWALERGSGSDGGDVVDSSKSLDAIGMRLRNGLCWNTSGEIGVGVKVKA